MAKIFDYETDIQSIDLRGKILLGKGLAFICAYFMNWRHLRLAIVSFAIDEGMPDDRLSLDVDNGRFSNIDELVGKGIFSSEQKVVLELAAPKVVEVITFSIQER